MDTKSLRSRRHVMEKKYNEESDEDISDWEESNDSNDSDEDVDRRSDNRKPFACDWIGCGKRFKNKDYIRRHQKRVHQKNNKDSKPTKDKPKAKSDTVTKRGRPPTKVVNEELKCDWPECGFVTSQPSRMTEHKTCHSKEQPFKCEECGTRFKRTHALNEHIKYLHSGRKLVCKEPGCNWTTVYPKNMKEHVTLHSRIRHFSCDYPGCDKTFFIMKRLNKHKKYSHINIKDGINGRKSFKKSPKGLYCEWPGCCYTSADPSSIVRHRECHKDYKDRSHVCDWPECGKRFTSGSNLSDHKRMHTNDKRYSCQWPGCEFRSVLSSNVNKHLAKHTKHMNEKDRKEIEEKYRIMKNIYQKKTSIESNKDTIESIARETEEFNEELNTIAKNITESKVEETIAEEVAIDLSEVSVEKGVIDNTSYGQINDCSQELNNYCNESIANSKTRLSTDSLISNEKVTNNETNIGYEKNFSLSIIEVKSNKLSVNEKTNNYFEGLTNDCIVSQNDSEPRSEVQRDVKHNTSDNDFVSNDIIGSYELRKCHEFGSDLSEINIKKEMEESSYEEVMNCFDGLTNDPNESHREVAKTSDESQSRGESKRSDYKLVNIFIIPLFKASMTCFTRKVKLK